MEIIDRESMLVLGIPVRANWETLWVDMPEAWQQFIRRRAEINHPIGETFFDVSLEKNGDEYVQLICSQVSIVDHIPVGMWAVEIPAQPFIHHAHVGPPKAIAETFGQMYDWAQQEVLPAGDFKVDRGYTVDGDENEHELFIGLLPEKGWRGVNRN